MTELRQARFFASSRVVVYVVVVVLAWNQSAPLPQPADHPAPTIVIVVPTFAELNQIGVVYRFIEWLFDPRKGCCGRLPARLGRG